MQLTADLYREILRSLRSDTRSSRNLEKRSSPRVGLRSRVTIVPAGGGGPVVVGVRDLSANGIGLVHTEAMPIGARFTAMFAGRVHDSLAVVYCVANCKELSKSQYSIGASVIRVDRGALPAVRPPVKRTSAA